VKENAWITVLEGTVQITAGGETVEPAPGSSSARDHEYAGWRAFVERESAPA